MKNNRKTFLINPKFQIRFIGHLIFAVAISIAIFYLAELFFFKEMMREGIEAKLPDDHVYFELILRQKALMDKVFMITGLIVFVFLTIFGVLLSHRIAGPLYKLNMSFENMAQKRKVERISFRDKDYFQELPESFNKAIEALEEDSKVS